MADSNRRPAHHERNDVPARGKAGFGRMVLALAVSMGVAIWLFPKTRRAGTAAYYSEHPLDHSGLPPAAYEHRDVSAAAMAAGFGGVILTLAVSMGLAMWLYPHSVVDRRMNAPVPTYPAPRLQEHPAQDMQRFYAAEMARLNSTGWVDRTHGNAHIPIDQAMKIIAGQGIPDWPGPKP